MDVTSFDRAALDSAALDRAALDRAKALFQKAARLFAQAGPRPSLEKLRDVRQALWPEEASADQACQDRHAEFSDLITRLRQQALSLVPSNKGLTRTSPQYLLGKKTTLQILRLAKKTLPAPPKNWDEIFQIPDEYADPTLSLDLLTPHFKIDMERRLSPQEQAVFIAIVEHLKDKPLGSFLFASDLKPAIGLPGTVVSACLEEMIRRGALSGQSRQDSKKAYAIKNPAAELWLRCRRWGLPASYPDIATKICPVFRQAHFLSAQAFWNRFCQEAGLQSPCPMPLWTSRRHYSTAPKVATPH